jgi:FkbM family methyltransferase
MVEISVFFQIDRRGYCTDHGRMGKTIRQLLPRPLRRWLRRLRGVPARLSEWPAQRKALGLRNAWHLGWSAFRFPIGDPVDPPGPLKAMQLPGIPHPFWYRQGTSDVQVIRQIFVRREYAWLQRLAEVRTLVDVGANIGGASVFFLQQFPQSRVVAVEPAPANFALLQRNLEPYGQRARCVQAAVWPTDDPLQLIRGQFRDGLDWSIQVAPASVPTGITGLPMARLIQEQQLESIDLLKIDIEGAERELFQADTTWLRQVHHLCLEIHDETCRDAVLSALRTYTFKWEQHEETTLFEDLHQENQIH